MSPFLILGIFLIYTLILFSVTWITARKADNQSFFIGNKVSPWFVVAYGMIGASLSGVTFMSVPGWVKDTQFSYMVVVLGYLFGYFVIALVLLPLYYRLKLTSIYSYLGQRFGFWSYKTGAGFFILSRTLGASLRMFLVINVLQIFVFDAWNVPFWVNVLVFIMSDYPLYPKRRDQDHNLDRYPSDNFYAACSCFISNLYRKKPSCSAS